MTKLLLVATPLALFAAFVVARAALGRPVSRHLLNVSSSVLLLGYIAATAGLGIFWVANQQLPPFDLHYLFGYGTVALVALHLFFNLPIVFRTIARAGSTERKKSPPPSRRTFGI